MENYFNYFTEIEEHFREKRGTILLLSTLDWALIETWKEAGIPLAAVLRGIDATFERWERRASHTRKINSLAFCSQEVLAAAEAMKEAAVGAAPAPPTQETGFTAEQVADYLKKNAAALEKAALPGAAHAIAREHARALHDLASGLRGALEEVERRLTVMEEKLFAALVASTPDEELLAVRREADRDLAPYRRKMSAAQIEQLHKQYVHKRLLERYGLPRLSLFYMQ
ncbi:MAG TPA: hypothetical protein VEG08_12905 [Terriglobales bacterium]|nr:hypothetical protein [Terriglobales bacterium]